MWTSLLRLSPAFCLAAALAPAGFTAAADLMQTKNDAQATAPASNRDDKKKPNSSSSDDAAIRARAEKLHSHSIVIDTHNDITSPTMRGEDTFHYRAIHPKAGDPKQIEHVDTWVSYPGRYKCSDTFACMGPWLVTKDEIPDPHDLRVSTECGPAVPHRGHPTDHRSWRLSHRVWASADSSLTLG